MIAHGLDAWAISPAALGSHRLQTSGCVLHKRRRVFDDYLPIEVDQHKTVGMFWSWASLCTSDLQCAVDMASPGE